MENLVNNCNYFYFFKRCWRWACNALSSGNIKFTPYSDANDVIDKLFKSLRSRYQENLETSMNGNDFIFDSVQIMYYKCHKAFFIHSGSCIDSRD